MKIVFFGTPQSVTPILENLAKNFSLVGIVTSPDKKAGRNQIVTPSPVKLYFKEELQKAINKQDKVTILTPEQFNSETIENLKSLYPDLFVVAAYGKLLPKEILAIPQYGTLCVHPSVLPKYRGPSPIPQTLLDGEKITGTTIIKMDEKMDHGSILSTKLYSVQEADTFTSLMTILFQIGADMLPETINSYINGSIKPKPQEDKNATFTKLITKQDGYIDLKNPPKKEQFERMIRAYYPWPGVWTITRIKSQEIRIKFLPENKIQVEGKKPVSIKDFINGYPEIKEIIQKLY